GPWRFLLDLLRATGRRLWIIPALLVALIAMRIMLPVSMSALIRELQTVSAGGGSVLVGVLLTAGFCALLALDMLTVQHYFNVILCISQLIVNALNVRIFGHALALSRKARRERPVGDVVNHMGTDTN